MESFKAINLLNKLAALVLALVVCFTQSFGRGCMYAVLFFVGAFATQMVMESINSTHKDSPFDELQLITGEPPDYMKRNIIITTVLLIGLNVALSVWMFR